MACCCGREGTIKQGDKVLCTYCFIERFEKRVKKALRERVLRKGERVLIVGDVAAYLFKKFVSVPLHVEYSRELKAGFGAVIIEWTLDDECVSFLEAFSGGLDFKEERVKMFKFLTDEDVQSYAELKKLFFVPRTKNKHWQEFLGNFDLDMKYNLLRSAGEIKKLV